jgi:hypothetical protein
MDYKVKKLIDLRPVFNIYWLIDSVISEMLIDRYFNEYAKENLILQDFIEPIEEIHEPMTAEKFIETYHPERWVCVGKYLEYQHVLELLKRFAKIVRKEERERICITGIIGLNKRAVREMNEREQQIKKEWDSVFSEVEEVVIYDHALQNYRKATSKEIEEIAKKRYSNKR